MPNMGKGGEVGQQSKFVIHMGLACGRAYTLDGIKFLLQVLLSGIIYCVIVISFSSKNFIYIYILHYKGYDNQRS